MNISWRERGAFLAIVLVLVGYTWGTWRFFTLPIPGGNDFLAHYTAWEAYIKFDINPYSDEAALYTQKAIYGRPARSGEDENRLTYPFYSILVHGPFILLDYALARAVYMTLLQIVIVLGVILTMRLIQWEAPIWLMGVFMAWSILNYPEARAIILGQFAPFAFLSVVGCIYLYQRGHDGWAGAALVMSTIKPTLVFLLVPFLLIYFITRRRWKAAVGFLTTLGLLIAGSFLALPSWFSDFILRLQTYSSYTVGQSPVWLLCHQYLPFLGRAGEILITLMLLSGLLFDWWLTFRKDGGRRFYWSLGLTLVVSNLIVPRSATTNYVMLLLPTIWVFSVLDQRWRWGRAAVVISMLVLMVGQWWLHAATVVGNQEQAVLFLPWPVLLGLVLVCGRRWLLANIRLPEPGVLA